MSDDVIPNGDWSLVRVESPAYTALTVAFPVFGWNNARAIHGYVTVENKLLQSLRLLDLHGHLSNTK